MSTTYKLIILIFLGFLSSPSCVFPQGFGNDDFYAVEVEPTVDLKALQENLVYPDDAFKKGIEGKVILKVLIEKDSTISRIEVQSSENKLLDSAAIQALKSVRCTPAIQNKLPVKVWVQVPVTFTLTSVKKRETPDSE